MGEFSAILRHKGHETLGPQEIVLAGPLCNPRLLYIVMPDIGNRASTPLSVMPDISNRASMFAFLFRMDPRYQPAEMTTGLLSAYPTCKRLSDALRQLKSTFLHARTGVLSIRLGMTLLGRPVQRQIDGIGPFLDPRKTKQRADLTGILPDIRLLPKALLKIALIFPLA